MASEPASLPVLPVEIMEFVVEQLVDDEAEGSLACLAQTCRGFHAIVVPRLYNKRMVERHPALIFWAAHLGRTDTAKRLLDAGIDLNRGMIRNESMANVVSRIEGLTPRQTYQQFYGIINNQIGPHDGVLRVGPRGFVGEPFRSLAHITVGNGPPSTLTVIPRQTSRWHSWWFPIHLAVQGGFTDLVELFISKGAYLDVPSGSFCACKYPTMLASIFPSTDRPSWMPLHTAICSGQIEIAKSLLIHGASVSLDAPRAPFTVLHNAAFAGSLDLVNFVLDKEYQTTVQAVDLYEMSPIWHAYLQGHWDIVDALLARGANIDDDLATGYTPLIDACLFGDFSKATELIKRGADVNMTCTAHPSQFSRFRFPILEQLECLRGHRPIDLCCIKQQGVTRSLRYRKTPSSPRFGMNHMPPAPPASHMVHVPEEQKRTDLVRALLDAGADMGPGKHSPPLAPPLVAAAAEHLIDVVRLLLDRGAPVDCTDKEGNTPLMATMSYGIHWCNSHSKIGPLSSRPFALQRPNRAVQTVPTSAKALSCRQRGNFHECVKLLIEHGASPTATNKLGASPLTLVYSPARSEWRKYKSERPRGHLTFKERAMVVSMLIGLGCDPNTTVNPRAEEDSDSEAEEDNFSIYSGSDSDTSQDTSPDSDRASSVSYGRTHIRRRPRSLYKFGPLSVLQCAFWDGDLDLCRSLLKAGAELCTPIVAWMLHITWGYCRYRMRFAAEQILQVLGDLDVDVQAKLGSHPICLLVLIYHRIWDMAEEMLPAIDKDKFKEVPEEGYAWLFGPDTNLSILSVSWGSACLYEAVNGREESTAEALLKLGIDPNTPDLEPPKRPLTRAIEVEQLGMVELLIRYGADVNIADDNAENPVEFSRTDRSNPMINAIRGEDGNIIGAILREQKAPLPEKFSFAYIREAYMIRSPKALSCLLTFPCLDPHGRSSDEAAETHLTDIIRNIIPICDYVGYDIDDEDITPWAISIRVKLERVRLWMECLILLARAGIDPTMRNGEGRSGLEMFGDMINYKGPDRFKIHVRSAVRSRLNDVMGDMVSDDVLEPEETFVALAKCEVDLADSSGRGTVTGSSISD